MTRRLDLALAARKINTAHALCLGAEADALHHAVRAGTILLAVKAQVGHGAFLKWIRANLTCHYNSALDYKRVAEWWSANPQRAVTMQSIRQVLEAIRQDRQGNLRTLKLTLTLAQWGQYWDLLGELGAKYEPVPVILDALARLAGNASGATPEP